MKQIILGGGTVALDVPDEWEIAQPGFTDVTGTIPEFPTARLLVSVDSFEHPESVLNDDVSFFVFEEGMPLTEDSSVAPESLFSYAVLPEGRETYVQVYKWGHILPPGHIRILDVRLELPSIEQVKELPDALMMQIREMIERSRFSDALTPLDGVALTEGLKRIQAEDGLFLRVPRGWRCGVTDDGRHYCDTADALDGTLWIDWDLFENTSGAADIAARDKATEFTAILRKMAHRDIVVEGGRERAWLWSVNRDVDDLAIFWGRLFVAEGSRWIVVSFSLVLTDSDAETPQAMTCRAIVEREVRNAVVLPDRF